MSTHFTNRQNVKVIWYLVLAFIPILLFLSCEESEEELETPDAKALEISVTALSPDETGSSRIYLSEQANSPNLSARFKQGEKIRIFMVQNGKVTDLGGQEVSSIENEGRSCKFSIKLPDDFEISQFFHLVGFNGHHSEGVEIKEGSIYWKYFRGEHMDLSFETPPVAFCVKDQKYDETTNNNMMVVFKHIGAYHLIHLKNRTAQEKKFQQLRFHSTEEWYKKGGSFDLLHWSINSERAGSELIYDDKIVLPANGVVTVAGWVLPDTEAVIPALSISYCMSSSNCFTTVNSSTAKNYSMQAGRAYHLYGIWDGNEILLTENDFTTLKTIHVSGISLDKSTISLEIKETRQLTAAITPKNATNKNIIWSSSHPDVASVTNGLVTALKNGITVITAKTEDGGFTATCSVKVMLSESGTGGLIDNITGEDL